MQSGYGASEIHQHHQNLIGDDGDGDGCCPSVFTISNLPQNNHLYHHHSRQHSQNLQHQKHPEQQQMFQPPPPSPFTHQLLRPFQTLIHQPQQQQGERLHSQLGLEVQDPCPTSLHPFFDVNFKLGLNENSGNNGSKHDITTLLHGSEQQQQHHHQSLVMPPHSWHSQEDSSAIKLQQPFWKPCVVDKDQPENFNKHHVMGSKYKHFGGELEAIYGLADAKLNLETNNHITGSGSSIIGVDNLDHRAENSIGEEKLAHEKKKRKRKMKEKLSSMFGFFEGLVKQVMDHQDGLHRKFVEVVQRVDREKSEREEAWRREETAKYNREAIAKAHEQVIALSREASIISHLERITGQSINLPPRQTALLLMQPDQVITKGPTKERKSDMISSRWPKAEVEALIQVRGWLESRFLEPGLKGPLWEEVSALMASMGYPRSAKRCKEKWENINKYFRKTKESGKKRSPQSKTCPYFDQLDRLYSRNNPINLPSDPDTGFQNQEYSELLEAFVAASDDPGNENENHENDHKDDEDEDADRDDDADEKED